MKFVVMSSLALFALGVTACAGSVQGQGSDDAAARAGFPVTSDSSSLTCKSYGLCTSYSVARYHGVALPAAKGGKLADGMYRLAYSIAPTGTGVTPREDSAEGILIRGSQFLVVGGINSSYGSFETTSGNDAEISFNPTVYCDSERADEFAAASPATPWARHYVVDAEGRLVIYGEDKTVAHVYVRASKLCGSPSSIPNEPGGDSSSCAASNCGCAEASADAPNRTTCDLIAGE